MLSAWRTPGRMHQRYNGQPLKLMPLCRRAGGGQGGNPMGPMGGPMDFGRNKSKFQEVPETGITFDDVAVKSCFSALACASCQPGVTRPSLRASTRTLRKGGPSWCAAG